ncbi:glycosyltransferase [Candidatus Wolfebacteria bacterium]|nr:glycosyltransferase [Candidatus Wolfebacteria bacterium]
MIDYKKIKKADIVIGIPSYNEENTIAFVVKQIDKGLIKYFPSKKAIIVNVDNNSSDKTAENFLKTKTNFPKFYVSSDKGLKGKGYNFKNLFEIINKVSSPINLVFDADLKSITPEWIKKMAMPIIKGYDFVSPVYSRDKSEALLTKHLCYPLIYGLLGFNIYQPIAGDFSFSLNFVKKVITQKWTKNVLRYGIDIFLTTSAIFGNFKICQVGLGKKHHRITSVKSLDTMFEEVIDVLFFQLLKHKTFWKNAKIITPEIFNKKTIKPPQEFNGKNEFFNYKKELKKNLGKENYRLMEKVYCFKDVNSIFNFWSQTVYNFIQTYEKSSEKEKLLRILKTLAFRHFEFYLELVKNLTYKEVEKIISCQAVAFRNNRLK